MMTRQQQNFIKSLLKYSSENSFIRDWEPVDFLGQGSFGIVYLLRRGDTFCAVKILRLTKEMSERYKAEINALKRIRGEQHAVHIYEYETINVDRGGYFEHYLLIRMEKLNKLPETMSEDEVINMGIQLSFFLEKCHSGTPKIYHRDIKPDNILVSDDGVYKLSDFSEAKITDATQNSTGFRGTPLYMSPEMHNFEGYDGRSDLYSLGVTMYALLNGGTAPFAESGNLTEAIRRRYNGEILPSIPGVSSGMMDILRRLCAVNRSDRYDSAQELGEALYSLARRRGKKGARTQHGERVTSATRRPYRGASTRETAYSRDEDITRAPSSGRDTSRYTTRDTYLDPGWDASPDRDRDHEPASGSGSKKRSGRVRFFRVLAAAMLTVLAVYLLQPNICLDYENGTDGCVVSGYTPLFSGNVKIPAKHRSEPVTGIGESAFAFKEKLTSVTIPDSVTFIGRDAFRGCTGLTSIDLPYGVKNIEDRAFMGCSSLASVSIPESVENIGNDAFGRCGSLTSVTVPGSVEHIGSGAFSGCGELESITLAGAADIGSNAFGSCTGLRNVYISDLSAWCNMRFEDESSTPFTYANDLYYNHSLLEELVIPDGVTALGGYAFCGCDCITSAVFPDSVQSIGPAAFWDCDRLSSVTLSGSVRTISEMAFANCSGLESFIVSDGVESIGDKAFSSCTGLQSVTIPASVKEFGSDIFIGSDNVTVYCNMFSKAWYYCDENEIPYKLI